MSILYYSVIVFVTQLIFIGFRTWNVKAIAEKNMMQAMVSGAVVHIAWLVSISIGAISMHQIMTQFDFQYVPVVCSSLIGGLIGTYLALKEKK